MNPGDTSITSAPRSLLCHKHMMNSKAAPGKAKARGEGDGVVGSVKATKVVKKKEPKAKAEPKKKLPKHLRPLPSDPLSRLNSIIQRLNLPAPTVHIDIVTETRYRFTYVVSKNANNQDTEKGNKENIKPDILFEASGDMCATRQEAQIDSATKILPALEAMLFSSAAGANDTATTTTATTNATTNTTANTTTNVVTTPVITAPTSQSAAPSSSAATSHIYRSFVWEEEDELDWDMDSLGGED
ncbi:uncharacterized protein MYCFIDRAFT_211887 [Pseudocercospora fijiensis CIRAD86]|uniref:Uncharacterized protein n=1 Tax=Pseudocercospora fijiensis (strain CIRAD86) TaxID=383855 RepID=M2ZLB2_PSEFD|nr:uncharacterized protein MYCFIDRAFT_211887 [Pseudocercospora fijiensis CIRAD86]EME79854.1 hypothetical protein MYCFIDRAFT_211887 [Pseudocercospora fijiensis CIRAD86]